MRNLVSTVVAFAATFAAQSWASAAERQFLIFVWDDGQSTTHHDFHLHAHEHTLTQQHGDTTQSTYHNEQHQHANVFEQILDLERRKNAWLIRTFFNQD